MNNSSFDELPIGFSMLLCSNESALKFFSNLDKKTKVKIINYIKSENTGYETKEKINKVINYLEQEKLNFL